jgi:hypothetical protein
MAKKIKVQKGDRILEVSEKAFNVVYSAYGYTKVEAEVEGVEETVTTDADLYELSREELEKIKNDDLKAFLNKEGIDFKSDAVKEDLVNLILGV